MIYRARTVLPLSRPPLADGAVAVRDGKIVAVGAWDEIRAGWSDEVEDLGEQVLLPGLINAHCHLDYSGMRGAIMPPESFAAWIQRINALKRDFSDDDYLEAIAAGLREAARFGTTSIANIEAFPELMPRLPHVPLRVWWFYELIDIRKRIATDELVAGALQFFEARPDWRGGFGLSPHAPYTATPELYSLARQVALAHPMPITTHMGESREEHDMFTAGRGPLYDFLAAIGRPMHDCGHGRTALRQLAEAGAIGPECLLVHLNEFPPEDESLLGPEGPLHGVSVAHCPASHRYFGHSAFRLERLRELQANVVLGTDSLASNHSLSLFAEMQALSRAYPMLAPAEVLALVTTNAARALGQAGLLGELTPGAHADLIAFPIAGRSEPHEEVVYHGAGVNWMRIEGERPALALLHPCE